MTNTIRRRIPHEYALDSDVQVHSKHGLGSTPTQHGTGKRTDAWNPAPLNENPAKQEALHCVSLRDPYREKLIDRQEAHPKPKWNVKGFLFAPRDEVAAISNPLQLLPHYQDLIQHHVALRTALFFQQAIACYNTPFYYRIAKTEGQYFTAPTLQVEEGTVNPLTGKVSRSLNRVPLKAKLKYEAAHSGTIPGLEACWRNDNNPAANTTAPYFSYLKGSQLEAANNSTIGFPDFVNKVDTLIDGQSSKGNAFRGVAIELLNSVATAQLTPMDATRWFLHHLKDALINRPTKSKSITPEKQAVIQQYLEQVEHMIKLAAVPDNIKGKKSFFDDQLNVNLTKDNPEEIDKIRNLVYERKFALIRQAQILETQIQDLFVKILGAKTPENRNFIWRVLVSYAPSEELRQTLEKISCISADAALSDPHEKQQIIQYYNSHKPLYDKLLGDIKELVRDFRKDEQGFQASLLRGFRVDLRHLIQEDLSDRIKQVVAQKLIKERAKPAPDYNKIAELASMPTSPTTVSRWENDRFKVIEGFKTPVSQRRKALTLRQARIVAKALNVQAGHFFCSFPASRITKP